MILKDKNVEFERLALALLKYETLTGEEIKDAINGNLDYKSDKNDTKEHIDL